MQKILCTVILFLLHCSTNFASEIKPFNKSGFIFNVNYNFIVPAFFIITSFLLISKLPTYSLKKIIIPRTMTIFLLFGIVLFFGFLLFYTFKILALSGLVYLILIPISFFHYKKIKKQNTNEAGKDENEDLEDIL